MIYLDNAATTPARKEVLDTFVKVSEEFVGNPNSIHVLGVKSKNLMVEATKQVADLLKVKKEEIIFTSSSSESNNLAIKGLFSFYPKRKQMIVTTRLEHDSVLKTIDSLSNVEVRYVALDTHGHILLDDLEEILKEEPLLVTIQHINSEVGIVQDINSIGALIKKYPKTFFHVDGTQSVGKIPVDLTNIDLFTFSAHKFFGLKGIACLVKKEKVGLKPLISGGASQSNYRAGTPSVALIASLAKALRYSLEEIKENYQHVSHLKKILIEALSDIPNVVVNSSIDDSPYILNISVLNQKPETLIHRLEMHEIYVATNTACSSKNTHSKTLVALKKSSAISQSSLRISFSKLNTEEQIKEFIKILREEIL